MAEPTKPLAPVIRMMSSASGIAGRPALSLHAGCYGQRRYATSPLRAGLRWLRFALKISFLKKGDFDDPAAPHASSYSYCSIGDVPGAGGARSANQSHA